MNVHLADAPTDVLVHLVGVPHGEHRTSGQILDAVVPDDADLIDAAATAARSLRLLIDGGYVDRRQVNGRTVFWATTAGRLAVAEAVAAEVVTTRHVERPTRMKNGQTYCSCGSPWPCPHTSGVVTPSRTDRQPPASSSNAKGGLAPVAPDETKRPDLVTHHEET